MSQKTRTLRRIPQTTLRRLRNIPTYFFLIWRWTWWFFALAWILLSQQKLTLPMVFLGITFIQSLVVTFYTPVLYIPIARSIRLYTRRSADSHFGRLHGYTA